MNRKFWLLYLLIIVSVCVFVAGFESNFIAFSMAGLFGIFVSGIVIGDHGGRFGYFGGDDD
ncbi:hypothetical protein RZ769_16265 [Enterobacter kobei]|uniref:hypothetical protein n=1 Tax=Enterobacter kobei TaxID=208224 RepID=UPI002954F894|nr:hypothetical protein [Enterobacter kobei]EKS6746835.1 hypothetical protein [Enterobacter kobei]MDV7019470.1 hypothetical protein [Enterobacter kobei]